MGVYKLLAVRVTTTHQQEPQETLSEIQGAVFGTGPDALEHSVVSQFRQVSHHQLLYEPALVTNGTDGVVEIVLNERINKYAESERDMIRATEQVLGLVKEPLDSFADRILFCLPDGSIPPDVWALGQFPGRVGTVVRIAVGSNIPYYS